MKIHYSFLFLGLLGLSLGQGFGGMTSGGEVLMADTFSVDDYGSSSFMVVGTNDGFISYSNPEEYPSLTPKPKRGTRVVQGSDVDEEADEADHVQMLYETYPVVMVCNFTNAADPNDPNTDGPVPDVNNPILLDWFKEGEQITSDVERMKVFQDNHTLLIHSAVRDDVGDYKCQTKGGEDKLSKSITLIFLEIRKMDKSQEVVENEAFSMVCPADGSPPPVITWLRNQKPIVDLMVNDSRISISPNDDDIPNGTLTIAKSEWGDRGNYSCIVTSLKQSYEKWTYLRVKDVYAALWPFIGIVIEVLILGIIIIIFEKRRAKAEFDESDTDQGNDQKNTGDRNKDRRRK